MTSDALTSVAFSPFDDLVIDGPMCYEALHERTNHVCYSCSTTRVQTPSACIDSGVIDSLVWSLDGMRSRILKAQSIYPLIKGENGGQTMTFQKYIM